MTAGKVGAAEVQQAIENMTNAGSRFGGLMEHSRIPLQARYQILKTLLIQCLMT